MKRLTLWLAVACITFAVGTVAALSWYVHGRPEPVLDESPAEREVKQSFQEGLTVEVPFCELVKNPKVYENRRRLRVLMSFNAGGKLGPAYFSAWCQDENDAVWIEYESEGIAAGAEQFFREIDRRMDDCWHGSGIVIGNFESSDGEGYGPQKNLPYRLVVSHIEPPRVYFCGQE